jgi:integrase/recombinase XerD
MKLSDCLNEWLVDLRVNNYAHSTITQASGYNGYFIRFLAKGYNVTCSEEIERTQIRFFIRHILKKKHHQTGRNMTAGSRLSFIFSVKQFIKYLQLQGQLEEDYLWMFEEIKLTPKSPGSYLTEKEVGKVIEVIPENTLRGFRDRTIFELFYCAGLRRREALELGVYDINFDDRKIFVRQGKGKKGRYVPMGESLAAYLGEYLIKVRPKLLKGNMQTEQVFVSERGEAISYVGLYKVIKRLSDSSGVVFSPHVLRHTFATHLLKNGASIVYIKELLGHERLSTTEVYTKVFPEDLKRIVREYHPRWS